MCTGKVTVVILTHRGRYGLHQQHEFGVWTIFSPPLFLREHASLTMHRHRSWLQRTAATTNEFTITAGFLDCA